MTGAPLHRHAKCRHATKDLREFACRSPPSPRHKGENETAYTDSPIAGDEYEPQNPEAVAATGFLTAGPFAKLPDNLLENERMRERYNDLHDMLSTIGTGFLGLTLGCARCHDRMYDAIPARDYYWLFWLSTAAGAERRRSVHPLSPDRRRRRGIDEDSGVDSLS